jgi:protein-S-isoprenylcysteine O-methyltransferase Ste14
VVAAIWVAAAFGTKRAVKKQSPATRLVELFCMMAAFELLFNPNPSPDALRLRIASDGPLYGWLSLLVICAGMAFTGLSLAFLVTAIGFGELRGFIGLPILVFGWKYKANVEERFMTGQFGERYKLYQREVKGLIPFVW